MTTPQQSLQTKVDVLALRGTLAARRLAFKVKALALAYYRSGRVPPEGAFDFFTKEATAALADMMLAAHLTAQKAPLQLQLSAFDATLRRLGSADYKMLRHKYDTDAFTIIKTLSNKINTSLRGTIYSLIQNGTHELEGGKQLREELNRLGVTGQADYSLRTIFRTQAQIALGAGEWDQTVGDPDINQILWGFRYHTAGDEDVRISHQALQGVTLPKTDPFWQRFWPPNGWNCRCHAIPLFEPQRLVYPPEGVEPDPGFGFNAGAMLTLSFTEAEHPRDGEGQFAVKNDTKVAAAAKSHKPSTVDKQRHAEANEPIVAAALKGHSTEDNLPMDVLLKKRSNSGKLIGIELKTMLDNGNDKITMHPHSRQRKLDWAKQHKAAVHTVVLDHRDRFQGGKFKAQYSGHEIYYRPGVGSFRLGGMLQPKDYKALHKLILANS